MVDSTIGTALMVIATLIVTGSLINALLPNIFTASDSIRQSSAETDDRMRTSFMITNYEKVSSSVLLFDVLNNGDTSVPQSMLQLTTVCLGMENTPLLNIIYDTSISETYWTYSLTGSDDSWDKGEILQLQVNNPVGDFSDGYTRIRIALPNGATGEHMFTV